MIGNRLTLSIHQAICLLVAGVACPGWALAAPANLGEQALMAQSGAANARAPESAQFNSSFLSGQAKQAQFHLDLLREKQPNIADTYLAWANFYASQGDLGAALQELQKAIALDPTRTD